MPQYGPQPENSIAFLKRYLPAFLKTPQSGLAPALATLGVGPAQATRLLRSAARGITPLKTVLATPITPSSSTASTLNAGATTIQTLNAASIPIYDPRISVTTGGVNSRGNPLYVLAGVTFPSISGAYRVNAHGQCIDFCTNAPSVDFGANLRGVPWIAYITDYTTRTRARIASNDIASTAADLFWLLGLGSTGPRRIQIYVDSSQSNGSQYFTQVNVTAGYDIWAPPTVDEVVIGVKLTVTDFFAERLGCSNPRVSGVGGTGFDYNGGTNNTFLQRLQAGDMDAARIGPLDLFAIPDSVNSVLNAPLSGHQAAAAATYAAARTAQPNAIIYSCSAQTTSSTAFNQSFSDAAKAGMLSLNDANMMFADSGPTGENWVPSALLTQWFTGTNNHMNDVGMVGYGYRMADSVLANVKAKYGL